MNLNTKLYTELKEKNLISIIRTNESDCAFIIKQFNTFSGEALPDIADAYSLPKLKAAIAETQAQLDGMLAILADTESVKVPVKPKASTITG